MTSAVDGGGSRVEYLLDFHAKKHSYGNLRFLRFWGAQKALARLANLFADKPDCKVLVGFGDWNCQDPAGLLKRCQRGPAKRFFHALRRVCTVVLVDEHLTSQLCCECAHQVKPMHAKVRNDAGVLQKRRLYSMRFCARKSCNARMNRDVNASRNILAMLLAIAGGGNRPAAFCRQHPP